MIIKFSGETGTLPIEMGLYDFNTFPFALSIRSTSWGR